MIKNTGGIISPCYTRKISLIGRSLTSTGLLGVSKFLHDWWFCKFGAIFWMNSLTTHDTNDKNHNILLLRPFLKNLSTGIMQEGRKAYMCKSAYNCIITCIT